jgi:Ca2+-binding RTX toxin-like protein
VRSAGVLAGVVAFIGAALITPDAGSAAEVSTSKVQGAIETEIKIVAGPGEVNDIALDGSQEIFPNSVIDVTEEGPAPLTAGEGCQEMDSGVRCVVDRLAQISVRLGDEEDRLDGTALAPDTVNTIGGGVQIEADGGEGADILIGSDGKDRLIGATGSDALRGLDGEDYLHGEAGVDEIRGGDQRDYVTTGFGDDTAVFGGRGGDFFVVDQGDDTLRGGAGHDQFYSYVGLPGGNDRMLGGSGRDYASFLCGSCAVTLDDRANDGRKNQRHDVQAEIVEIRSALFDQQDGLKTYGTGDDLITGDGSDNNFQSYRGNDQITGGAGEDRINSGRHADLVHARDSENDFIDCGDGTDTAIVDRVDEVKHCENVSVR